MSEPIQVANVFIELANSDKEGSITNLKLNKLLYYAQGWSLARTGNPLFSEDILAWQYGPIVQSVYSTFHVCGSDPIAAAAETGNADALSQEEIQLIIDVYRKYGRYSASTLVDMTHEFGSPWQRSYTGRHDAVIGKQAIKEYFLKEEPLSTFQEPNLKRFSVIGRRAESGATILPKDDEWDDDYE